VTSGLLKPPDSAAATPAAPPAPSLPDSWSEALIRPASPPAAPRRWFAVTITWAGFVYLFMTLLLGAAAITEQANLLYIVFGLMIGIFLISGVISKMVLSRLSIKRVLPAHASVGEPCSFVYDITNRKRLWASLSVRVSELDGTAAFAHRPSAYLTHVPARASVRLPIDVTPRRRGVYSLRRFEVTTAFPFGLVRRSRVHKQPDSLVVFPALAGVDERLINRFHSREQSGAKTRPRGGGLEEFYGVKEYRPGENPRLIYWRRSARTGVLVSREMSQAVPPRIVVLVDTQLVADTAAGHAALERSIAQSASLASYTLDLGMSVGLAVWSGEWTLIAPSRGKRHRIDILAALAALPRNDTHSAAELLSQADGLLVVGTTPILFTPRAAADIPRDGRRGLELMSTAGGESDRWFHFGPDVDFSQCGPADAQPPPPTPMESTPAGAAQSAAPRSAGFSEDTPSKLPAS
jgi:uncharacterized protein (DUF58 family)